ncbi:hypothetical protein LSCM1_04254 [Leishmania martiniquensis]|uniref:Zinc finger Mcm10/DnaG-type domain-containing protein n=1 Tax=Leishmania martiniquensis TaxID=1580590 RepID=A0A836KHV9_9TRYP|nr:hypothetical protein LSCM1_04254 [Leishmania martiniquensis]
MSDDLFDVFNAETPPLAPAQEVVLAVADASAPSATLLGPPADSLTSTSLARHPDGASDAPASPPPIRSFATPRMPTLSPKSHTPASAHPAPHGATASRRAPVSSDTCSLPFSRHARRDASSLPHASSATPVPVRASVSGGVVVIKATPSSCATPNSEKGRRSPDGDGGITAPGEGAALRLTSAPPPPSAVITETLSRIRIRRPTVSLEQFSVRLAEFPFASFDVFRGLSRHSEDAVARTCVGVVTRKSDPKQSTASTRSSRYAVLTLWSLEGISPSPGSELSFLLCGRAFDPLYSRLVTGAVVALSNVPRCTRQGSSPVSCGADEVLLRVADSEAVRELGFAADLGRCVSVSHKSKERCHAIVNMQRSQHCIHHVAGLRNAARGGGAVGQDRNSMSVTQGASTSPMRDPAAIRGNALTAHLTLSGAQQRLTVLAPGAAAQQSTGRYPAGSRGSLPLSDCGAPRSGMAASLKMLRQTSFFAVRGVTGTPVEDAALRRGVNSAASGVYGGVQAGAPLALRQQVGLRPAASYPSAQALGVTSRGRDVLEAARQKAVLHEEEKFLWQSLRRERTVSAGSEGLPNPGHAVGCSRGGGADINLRARGTEGNVNGATAGRNASLSLTAGGLKRARTEVTLSSTLAPVADHLLPPCSSTSRTAHVTSTSATASAAAASGADASRVEALRQQYQPLHRSASVPFTPLKSHGSVHAVIASPRERNYRSRILAPGAASDGSGASASQNALLRAAFRAAKNVASRSGENALSEPKASVNSSARTPEAEEGAESALTLLGSVADSICSAHDHLRSEADRQRLLTFVDKQITMEKALGALEAITEQKIKAHYCYACRCWYGQPPTTCVEQHHRIELRPALKKYIKCEHCDYKTFVIGGDEAKGWKVYPHCPRCHQPSFWVRGDAALQVSAMLEVLPPS